MTELIEYKMLKGQSKLYLIFKIYTFALEKVFTLHYITAISSLKVLL